VCVSERFSFWWYFIKFLSVIICKKKKKFEITQLKWESKLKMTQNLVALLKLLTRKLVTKWRL